MFRKSTAILFKNLPRVVSRQRFSGIASASFSSASISREAYESVLSTKDEETAKCESINLFKSMSQRSSAINAHQSLVDDSQQVITELNQKNADEKARVNTLSLCDYEVASSIVKGASKFEAALLKSLSEAVEGDKKRCIIQYIPGHHVNFINLVLRAFNITMTKEVVDHPTRGSAMWYELRLPNNIKARANQLDFTDKHPVYAHWLSGFAKQLEAVLSPKNEAEQRSTFAPML